MSAHVREYHQGSRRNNSTADGQAIESVRQVYSVAGAHDDDTDKRHERQKSERPEIRMVNQGSNNQVGAEVFGKRNHKFGRVSSVRLHGDKRDGDQKRGQNLQSQLGPSRKAKIPFVDHLLVVVSKSDSGIGDRGKYDDPDKPVTEVGPEQRGYDHRDRDEQSAHGGRAGFFLVCLGSLFANELADLELLQSPDDDRPDDQAREQGRQAGERRAER